MARFQVRQRENSPFFPFAVIDSKTDRQVIHATTRPEADKAARRLNREMLA